jgi:radical SAM protein with 4Fe4S-binding SPASM domain
VGILSNLTLCDEEKVSVLFEAEATVQVSLYSMNPDVHDAITKRPGSFAKTKAAIEQLRKKQIPCFISCPTMKQNYKDYLDVLAYARGLKMDAQTDFVIMGKMNCDTSNLDCRLNLEETRTLLEDIVYKSLPINNEYFDPVKKEQMLKDEEWGNRKVCGACISSVCLDADGHYYPCPAFGGINLGSCFEHDLSWIWNESPETLRIRAVTGKDFKKCLHCPDRDYCSTCMCRNFNETGDIFKPAEHFCKVAAINHEVVDEYHKKLMGDKSRA